MNKQKIFFYISNIGSSLFLYVFVPFFFTAFFLMGAIDAKYVPESQFQGMYHGNLTMANNATNVGLTRAFNNVFSAFGSVFDKFYSMGYSHPNFWLWLVPLIIFGGIFGTFVGLKKAWSYEAGDAQEIIDNLTEQDYEEAEKDWKKLLEKKADIEKNPEKYKRKKLIGTIIAIAIVVAVIVFVGYIKIQRYWA